MIFEKVVFEEHICRIKLRSPLQAKFGTKHIFRIIILRGHHYGTDKDVTNGAGSHYDAMSATPGKHSHWHKHNWNTRGHRYGTDKDLTFGP